MEGNFSYEVFSVNQLDDRLGNAVLGAVAGGWVGLIVGLPIFLGVAALTKNWKVGRYAGFTIASVLAMGGGVAGFSIDPR